VKHIARTETWLNFEQVFNIFVASLDQIHQLLAVPHSIQTFAQTYIKWLEVGILLVA